MPVFINPSPRRGQAGVVQSVDGSGWGGRPHEDGESASVSIIQGDVHNSSIESLELRAPIVILRRELAQDSAGAGKYRGGLGVTIETLALAPGMFTVPGSEITRKLCPPWGLWGGRSPVESKKFLATNGDEEYQEVVAVRRTPVTAGGRILTTGSGGAGWGDPLERSAEVVLEDVLDGHVSRDAAFEDYGVVLTGKPLVIDVDATKQRRVELAESRATDGEKAKSDE
jgi:N-methylhydantoinase B